MTRALLALAVLSLAACTYPPNVLVATPVAIPSAEPTAWIEGGAFASAPWTTQSDSPVFGPHASVGVPVAGGLSVMASGGVGSDGPFEGPEEALSQQRAELGVTYSVVRSDVHMALAAGVGLGRVSDRVGRDVIARQNRVFAQVNIGRGEPYRLIPFTPVYASGGAFIRFERLGLGDIDNDNDGRPAPDTTAYVLHPGIYLESGAGPLVWSVQVGGAVTLNSLWPTYVLGGMYVAPSVRYRF